MIKAVIQISSLLGLILSSLTLAQGQEAKLNKLVEFKGFGQWEVWCLDIEQAGNIECNLNHVLRYKPHPDF